MFKKRNRFILFFIIILAFFAANLSYPGYFNQAADFFTNKLKISIPHFWDKPFKLGLDLQGGTHLVYEADLSNIAKEDYSSSLQGLRDIIERRVNVFGITEPVVQTQQAGGQYRLVVELAGIKDPSQAIQMIGQTPFLEFKEQRTDEETKRILDKIEEVKDKTFEEIQGIENWQMAFEDPYFQATELTGKYLKKSNINFNPTTNKPEIELLFNDEGAKLFEDITARNAGKQLAIAIDGQILSAPTVQEKISGGKAQITGEFTVQWARDLVKNLNAGALPVPIKLISEQTVGPILGAISLQKSLTAGLYGFLAVIAFMLIFYRLPGLFSSLALGIYVALVLALFKLIPVTLTLAGIGGFILSIGMAVDANILIFARMKEELRQGKTVHLAIAEGFRRAWPSIRDSNLNSLIVCAILFSFATSFIKGFALTLGLGIVVSMFSAIFITRILLLCFLGEKVEKHKWLL